MQAFDLAEAGVARPRQLTCKTGGPGGLSHPYTEALLRDAVRRTAI